MNFREPPKDYTHMYVLGLIIASLFGAIALAEFCKFLDKNPTIKKEIGL